MKYAEMHADEVAIAGLLAKKRLGSRQKERLAMLSDRVAGANQPPATPRRAPTGVRGDFQGNVFAAHYQPSSVALRKIRRSNRFGRGDEKPLRSRVQRRKRVRRTGGVR